MPVLALQHLLLAVLTWGKAWYDSSCVRPPPSTRIKMGQSNRNRSQTTATCIRSCTQGIHLLLWDTESAFSCPCIQPSLLLSTGSVQCV